ncbi:MAG: sugar ABC transporter ATP-binding protein [Thermoleophilaceae bacterium]
MNLRHVPESRILSVSGVSKSFGATVALDRVSLEIQTGHIHALVGQNGSGKSTLIKIIAGVHEPDDGAVVLHGQELRPPLTTKQLRQHGIAFVHQDLGLVGTMSVLDNLRVGRYAVGAGGWIRWRRERELARMLLKRFELDVDPDIPANRLPRTERAILAIVRALHDVEQTRGSGVLVLDEPTTALPAHEVERLFGAIRRVAEAGSSILFVTHKLDEVLAVADRVSVLRDGQLVATKPTASVDERGLIALMLGHEFTEHQSEPGHHNADVVMEVRNLSGRVASDVSLSLHTGEILGVTGLVGAGHEEIPYLIYGAQPPRGGLIAVGGVEWTHPAPARSKAAGVVLLPADRERDSAIPHATVRENVTLPALRDYRSYRGFLHARERADVAETLTRFDVVPLAPERAFRSLSGGNQQKALLGRWLRLDPRILLLHEPTQGVDVASRNRIFGILRETALRGTSVLYASVEYGALAELCDRVLVFRNGRVIAHLSGDLLTEDQLVKNCYQSSR